MGIVFGKSQAANMHSNGGEYETNLQVMFTSQIERTFRF